MADVAPPPTYESPVVIDEVTSEVTFSPIWLKWFISLAGTLNTSGGSVTTHNNLGGLQGGVAGQYFHMTSAEASGMLQGTELFLDFGTREVAFV